MAASSWNSVDPSSIFPLSMYAIDCRGKENDIIVHEHTGTYTYVCKIDMHTCSYTPFFPLVDVIATDLQQVNKLDS